MTLIIACPNCNFTKEISEEKVPANAGWATCPRCKNRIDFSPLRSDFDPAQGQETSGRNRPERNASPWENRSDLGIWQGIFQTFKSVLFSPKVLFSSMAFSEGMGEPFAFGLLFGSIGTMFSIFWQFLAISGKLISLSPVIELFPVNIIFIGIIIITPIFVIMSMFINGGIMHLCLRVVRGGNNDFEGTFRVVAFSQATQILGVIPFIGGMIGSLWNMVILIIGLKEIHETSYLRVTAALLIPVGVLILLGAAMLISLATLL